MALLNMVSPIVELELVEFRVSWTQQNYTQIIFMASFASQGVSIRIYNGYIELEHPLYTLLYLFNELKIWPFVFLHYSWHPEF